jgi:hypothetical protein
MRRRPDRRKAETLVSKAIAETAKWMPDVHLVRVQSGQVKVRGGWMHNAPAGTADLLGVGPGGRALACEIKTEDGELSPEQEAFAAMWKRKGGLWVVVRSKDEFMAAMLEARGVPFVGGGR